LSNPICRIVGAKTIADYENIKNQCVLRIKELEIPTIGLDQVTIGSVWSHNSFGLTDRYILTYYGGATRGEKLQLSSLKPDGTLATDGVSSCNTPKTIHEWLVSNKAKYLGQAKITVAL